MVPVQLVPLLLITYKRGYEVTVLEKESFVGGRTHGYEDEQVRFDTGASFYQLLSASKRLVKKTGDEGEVIELERVGLKYTRPNCRI